jgi:hypothetical protein
MFVAFMLFFTVALPRAVRNATGVVHVAHTQFPGEFFTGGVVFIVFCFSSLFSNYMMPEGSKTLIRSLTLSPSGSENEVLVKASRRLLDRE